MLLLNLLSGILLLVLIIFVLVIAPKFEPVLFEGLYGFSFEFSFLMILFSLLI